MIVAKIHRAEGRLILTAVDSSLIGKVYEEKNAQLDLRAEFFKGERIEVSVLKKWMEGAHIIFLVGKESVQLGQDEGLVQECKRIAGIPYAQVVRD